MSVVLAAPASIESPEISREGITVLFDNIDIASGEKGVEYVLFSPASIRRLHHFVAMSFSMDLTGIPRIAGQVRTVSTGPGS